MSQSNNTESSSVEQGDKYTLSKAGRILSLARNPKVYLFVLLAACLILIGYFLLHKPEKPLNTSATLALLKNNNCSKKSFGSESSLTPTTDQLEASIYLLRYRASCYEGYGNNAAAISTLEELSSYYKKAGQPINAGSIQQEIKNIRITEAGGAK